MPMQIGQCCSLLEIRIAHEILLILCHVCKCLAYLHCMSLPIYFSARSGALLISLLISIDFLSFAILLAEQSHDALAIPLPLKNPAHALPVTE